MAFLQHIVTDAGTVGLWELTEDSATLSDLFVFSPKEKNDYENLKNERRKREFLAVRMLLSIMMKSKTEIIYTPNGKPILADKRLKISISHSGQLAAIILSEKKTGIDVENIYRNVTIVARRFLNPSELKHTQNCNNTQVMQILYWSAKEAIYKCHTGDNISFRTQIAIHPFKLDEKSGHFTGSLIDNVEHIFSLEYFFCKNNVVIYCVETSMIVKA